MKEGFASDKSFRKTFGRKKIIQSNQGFQRVLNPNKSNQVNMSDEVKARELALEGKSR